MLRLEKRQPLPLGKRLALPFIAIAISFVFSFLLILLAGENPFTAFGYMVSGAFGSERRLIETLIKTTPLILTGLAAAVAFKAKFYNLGGEGQLYLGALVATLLGITLSLPPLLHICIILASGALAGGLWALLAGILKAKLKVDEVVVTGTKGGEGKLVVIGFDPEDMTQASILASQPLYSTFGRGVEAQNSRAVIAMAEKGIPKRRNCFTLRLIF